MSDRPVPDLPDPLIHWDNPTSDPLANLTWFDCLLILLACLIFLPFERLRDRLRPERPR